MDLYTASTARAREQESVIANQVLDQLYPPTAFQTNLFKRSLSNGNRCFRPLLQEKDSY